MQSNNNLCRYCLQLLRDANVELTNEVTQKRLGVLLIKLDLDVSENPLICKRCSGILDEIYMFKSKCLHSEDIVKGHFKRNIKVSLRDILIELENKPSVDIAEDQVVCRLCIKIPPNGNYITLSKTSEEVLHCRNMIQIWLPEIDLNITEEPMICEACNALLKNYLSFATSCINVEQKIKMYCEYQRRGVKDQVDLLCVLQFTENKALDCENRSNGDLVITEEDSSVYVKAEEVEEIDRDNLSENYCTDGHITELYIKEEEVEIKAEDELIRMETKESGQLDDSNKNGKTGPSRKKRRINRNETDVKTHCCPKCPYSAKYSSSIRRHMRSHTHDKIWECGLCAFTTRNLFLLKTHIRSHRGPTNMFGCTECPYETEVYQLSVEHVLKHKDKSEVEMRKCPLCPYKSTSRTTLSKHRRMQHDQNVKIYRCKECSWSTKYLTSHIRHQMVHKKPKDITTYKCEKCEYQTMHKAHLAIHVLTHEEGKFKCQECPYRGKRIGDIRRHMTVHSKKNCFSCDECTYSTHLRDYLRRHKRNNHMGVPKITLQCDQCEFRTNRSTYMSLHKKTHDPTQYKFKCEHCEYSTYLQARLRNHLVAHMELGETVVYYCATCDFKSKHKSSLRSHVKNCLKKKRTDDTDSRVMLQCNQCDFRTKCKTSLYLHKKTHDPNKSKLNCEQCKFSTYDPSGFKRHLVTHMELEETVAYYCETCNFKTKYKNSITCHVKSCSNKKE